MRTKNKAAQKLRSLAKPENMARTKEQAQKAAAAMWSKPHRPGIIKAGLFERSFPHKLICNEWQVTWPVTGLKWKTYNPDFYCPALDCYIECCTSKGNYIESAEKWSQCIEAGRPLRVYWWQGQEITEHIMSGRSASSIEFVSQNEPVPDQNKR